jgi:membrane-bound lytic murein transglycosylase A
LRAGRSIAVDKALHVYGTPFFIDAKLPIASDQPDIHFRRLMVAQDTGSAIVGPARADLYFGAGSIEGRISGRLRHNGRFAVLVPRELDPFVVTAPIPLPRSRPATAGATPVASHADPAASADRERAKSSQ